MLNFLAAVSGNGAGGGGSYESISSVVGNGSATTLTFSSIPSTYQHLQIRFLAMSGSGSGGLNMTINGATSGYAFHYISGYGGGVSASGSTSQPDIDFDQNIANSTSWPIVGVIDIHDYASTSKNKTVRAMVGQNDNASTSSGFQAINLVSALYPATSAVTSLSFITNAGSFSSNTRLALYGIKGA